MTHEEKFNDLYDFLLNYEIATLEEMEIGCYFNGRRAETLEDILFYKTACRSKEAYRELIGENEEE